MRGALIAAPISVALLALSATPAGARADPVVPLDPFLTAPESCIVPALFRNGATCPPLGAPERDRVGACTLPAVYLGDAPGPCPGPQQPPRSRVIPLDTTGLTR